MPGPRHGERGRRSSWHDLHVCGKFGIWDLTRARGPKAGAATRLADFALAETLRGLWGRLVADVPSAHESASLFDDLVYLLVYLICLFFILYYYFPVFVFVLFVVRYVPVFYVKMPQKPSQSLAALPAPFPNSDG